MKNVLIIEDDKISSSILEKFFWELGWSCETVSNLVEAQSCIQEDAKILPNLIVLDIHLPDGNGIEFLWDLRKWEETNGRVGNDGIPVIVLTGDEDLHLFHEANIMGCVGYLLKPIQLDKISSELERLSL